MIHISLHYTRKGLVSKKTLLILFAVLLLGFLGWIVFERLNRQPLPTDTNREESVDWQAIATLEDASQKAFFILQELVPAALNCVLTPDGKIQQPVDAVQGGNYMCNKIEAEREFWPSFGETGWGYGDISGDFESKTFLLKACADGGSCQESVPVVVCTPAGCESLNF